MAGEVHDPGKYIRLLARSPSGFERDWTTNTPDFMLFWNEDAREPEITTGGERHPLLSKGQWDAVVDSNFAFEFADTYVTLADAIEGITIGAVGGNRLVESIFVRKAEGDTAAITIASTDNVHRIVGKDADTTEIPVDITCDKDDVTFEHLKLTKFVRVGSSTDNATFESILISGGSIQLTGTSSSSHVFRDIRSPRGSDTIPIQISTGASRLLFDGGRFGGSSGTKPTVCIRAQGTVQKAAFTNLHFNAAASDYAIDNSGSGKFDMCSFTNLIFEDCRDGSISLSDGSDDCKLSNIEFDSSLAMLDGAAHLRLESSVERTVITNCSFEVGTQSDLLVDDQHSGVSSTRYVNCTFTTGTIKVSRGTTFVNCFFGSTTTIDFQSKADIQIIGGFLSSSATLSNVNADLVIRAVGQQNDRGDFVHGTGSTRLNDDIKLKLGTGGDAELSYDGTDMVVNPLAVGSGDMKMEGAIRLEYVSPTLKFVDTNNAAPLGEFNLTSAADFLILSGRNAADDGFENMVIFERLADGGRTFFDGPVRVDIIDERVAAAGVTIETVLLKDGNVDGVTVDTHAHDGTGTGGAAVPATNVPFTAATGGDWDGGSFSGDVDDALDQLAERVEDLELSELWWDVIHATGAAATRALKGDHPVMSISVGNIAFITGIIPADWVSTVGCFIRLIPDATETAQIDLDVVVTAVGQDKDDSTTQSLNETKDLVLDIEAEWDITSLLGSPAAGDQISIKIDSNTTTLHIQGVRFIYQRGT